MYIVYTTSGKILVSDLKTNRALNFNFVASLALIVEVLIENLDYQWITYHSRQRR